MQYCGSLKLSMICVTSAFSGDGRGELGHALRDKFSVKAPCKIIIASVAEVLITTGEVACSPGRISSTNQCMAHFTTT